MDTAPRGGFWCVTDYDDCVTVNRDYDRFSSNKLGSLFQDMDEANLEQQRLMMLKHGPADAHPIPAPREQGLHTGRWFATSMRRSSDSLTTSSTR